MTPPVQVEQRRRRDIALLLIGILAVSVNQRPALVAVGPLTDQLRRDLNLGASAASLLTTLPLLCFGVFALAAPALGRRTGMDRAVVAAGIVLIVGIAIRTAPPVPALFVGSAVAGAGIAVMNVLVPAVIKRDFPARLGLVTALYTVMLNGGAALAAGATAPLGHLLHLGWRPTLALWGVLAVAAALLWAPQARRAPAVEPTVTAAHPIRLWRNGLAWAVSMFMGLQSLLFYSLIAWVPTILHDDGLTEAQAGFWLAVLTGAGIVASFAVPLIAARQAMQRPLVIATAALFLTGLAGLIVSPTGLVWLWMLCLGVAQGAGISLAMMMFVHRARDSETSAELSGMAQAVGYLVAAAGPLAAGALRDVTGGWALALALLAACAAALLVTGWIAMADRTVDA
ncbi:cyanate permease [Mycolicibacterium chubuense NBB4]|uniref:Cyanate permease n=1 Tax=Mycolicibacterium chubuense (strain NBB4) TaxID=710421 RepID=I4BNS6_MYCCN|nr:MFS transporter [Mycolicibacterium chubuense]AFM18933.1 cyanate permease [Mycolicibacterium chubuense NBB4]